MDETSPLHEQLLTEFARHMRDLRPRLAQETSVRDGKVVMYPALTDQEEAAALLRNPRPRRPRARAGVTCESYPATSACAECRGACCKRLPGCAMPSDFGRTRRDVVVGVRAVLLTGRWCLDWWEGDPRPGKRASWSHDGAQYYFVRPCVKGHEHEIFHPTWGGECTFLASDGCELSLAARPSECRLLEPRPADEHCVDHGASKRQASVAWAGFGLKVLGDELEADTRRGAR